MKAIVQERYGTQDELKLREIDKPVAGADEVLVRVRAASIHPDIWHVVRGRPFVVRLMDAGFFRPKNPIRALGADEVIDYAKEDFTRRGVRFVQARARTRRKIRAHRT